MFLLSFGCFIVLLVFFCLMTFCVFLLLFDDGGGVGAGWDVNVHDHVTLKLFHG